MNVRFRLKHALVCMALVLGVAGTVRADVVNVWGLASSHANTINSFYDGLSEHSSVMVGTGPIADLDLTGVALLWVIQPAADFSGADITAMSTFLSGGGRIAFMGEHGGCCGNPPINNRITATVSSLGGHIVIVNNTLDGGSQTATRVGGQILDHPLTTGVDTYAYAAFASLNISDPAQTLMLGNDLTSVMMAFENVGAGSIFLITDQNVVNFGGTNDNDVMFENLLEGVTGAPPPGPGPGSPATPIPTLAEWAMITLVMLLGFVGAARLRRTA